MAWMLVFISWPVVCMKLLSVVLVSALDLVRTSRFFSKELSFFSLLLKLGRLLGFEFCWLKLGSPTFRFCVYEKFK